MATPTRRRKPKAPVIPERDVQAACKAWLEMQGCIVKRRNTGAVSASYKGKSRFIRFSEPGAADLYGTIGTTHYELEIKRRGERPTLEQVEWLLEWDRQGVPAFWVDSVERLQEVYRHLMAGGVIRYLPTTREYTTEIKGVKAKVKGPSGDYELA